MQPAAGVFLHVVGVCSPAQRAFPRFLRIISPTSLKTLFGTVSSTDMWKMCLFYLYCITPENE
jgi:hypothetical protein